MCGIVGVISTLEKTTARKYDGSICSAFDDMLWADQLRGTDGTGVMCLDSDGVLLTDKVAGGYGALKAKKDIMKIMNFVDTNKFTIGHNRSATKGIKDNAANAHPFIDGDIALVHNGTLHWINHKYKDSDPQYDVDSKAATHAISDLGIEKAVNELSGAYAFVWINKKDMTLNIIRNDQRPLGFIKAGPYIFIASEPSLAVWCGSRNGVKFDADSKIEVFQPDTLYTWEVDSLEFSTKKVERKWSSYNNGYSDDEYLSYLSGGRGSSTFPGRQTDLYPKSQQSSLYKKSGTKERIRLLSPNSPESPYTVNEKLVFVPYSAKEHKNLSRITSGEIQTPHAGVVNKHRVVGNTKHKATDIIGDGKLLEGIISAIYKTDSGFFVFELRDIVKHVPISYMPVVVDKKKDKGNVVDMKTGDAMVDCECCGTSTPESKLVVKKRSITDTTTGVRIKMKFSVCPACDVKMNDDAQLMTTMTEKRVAAMSGQIQ